MFLYVLFPFTINRYFMIGKWMLWVKFIVFFCFLHLVFIVFWVQGNRKKIVVYNKKYNFIFMILVFSIWNEITHVKVRVIFNDKLVEQNKKQFFFFFSTTMWYVIFSKKVYRFIITETECQAFFFIHLIKPVKNWNIEKSLWTKEKKKVI